MLRKVLFFGILFIPIYLFGQQTIDPKIDKVIDSLLVQGDFFRKKKRDYDSAIKTYESAAVLSADKFGKQSAEYAQSLYRIALGYYRIDRVKSADYFDSAQQVFLLFGDEYIDQGIKSLYNCSLINFNEYNYEFSLAYALKVLDLEKNVSQIQNKSIKIIYDILSTENRYDECLVLLESKKDLDFFRYNFEFNVYYADVLLNLNRLQEANEQALHLELNFLNVEEFSEFYRKRRLATLFYDLNQLSKSEYYFSESERLTKLIPFNSAKKMESLARHKINYANFCFKTGAYEKAENIYLDLINSSLFDSISDKIAMAFYENLSVLYINLGATEKASFYLKQFFNERDGQLKGRDLIAYKANMSTVYSTERDFDRSKQMLMEALSVYLQSSMSSANIAVKLYSNLAVVCLELGSISEARSYIDKTIGFRNISRKNALYTKLVFAQVEIAEGNYEAAASNLDFYLKSLNDNESSDYKRLRFVLDALIELNVKKGNTTKAKEYCNELADFTIKEVVSIYSYLPSKLREKYLERIVYDYILVIQSWAAFIGGKEMESLSLRLSLFFKGLQLKSNIDINQYLSETSDNRLLELKDSVDLLRALKNPDQRDNQKLYTVQRKLQEEYSANTSFNLLKYTDISYVRKLLKKKNAYIQFLEYETAKGSKNWQIGASILTASGEVSFVPLCSKETVENMFREEDEIRENIRGINVIKFQQNKLLYDSIWAPLEPYLNKKNEIFYSPTGILNLINIGVLENPDGDLVIEKYDLLMLSSVSSLEEIKNNNYRSNNKGLLIGGVDYEPVSGKRSESYSSYWPYLSVSALEVEQLKYLLRDENKIEVLEGKEATEEAFVKTLQSKYSPRFIHIATHGHYEPMNNDLLETKLINNSMFNSCLVLSGANNLGNEFLTFTKGYDGILSAAELSDLNLVGTELVVLSSCNSGLGDISNFEGMFGLARALKLAGVKYVIMTLSPVADNIQLVEFVRVFYSYWLDEGNTIPKAFSNTQKDMIKEYGKQNELTNFVLYK